MRTKTYVVTGATSGIGRALVERLSASGMRIFAGYRDAGKAESLAKIEGVEPFYVDYAKPETIPEACEGIKSSCDKIDRLINIAGCVVAGPVERISIDEIRRQFDVNVFSHLEMAQNLAEKMNGGRIINISSMSSYGIFPYISPYCASKRALDMFFNSFLIENKRNIEVVSIKPGVISTPLWEKSVAENIKYLKDCADYESEMEYVIKNARKNGDSGLSSEKVVDVILRVDRAKRPKLSYTVGCDAFFASIFSKLPQSLVNSLIRANLEKISKK